MADIGFWVMAGALSFAVGALLLRGMARGASAASAGGDAAAKALALYRDQLAEVERDLARGTLSADEAAPLRIEVQRRILELGRKAGAAAALGSTRQGGPVLGLVAVMAALAGAVALYLQLGAPAYPDLPLAKRLALAEALYANRPTQAEAEAAQPPAPEVAVDRAYAELMAKLRAAVAERPGDVQGLALLAKSEAGLQRYPEAARAYTALIAAKGAAADAGDHLNAAQAMIAAAGGEISPEAEAHLTATLQLDPDNAMARYLSGLLFVQTGRPDRAFALWEPLARASDAGAPWAGPLAQMLPDVAAAAGLAYTPPQDLARLAGPSAADVAGAAEMGADERAVMINTMVAGLEERLLSQGGSAEEWQRLITSLGVLGQMGRLRTALAAGEAALAGDAAALAALRQAAAQAGLRP